MGRAVLLRTAPARVAPALVALAVLALLALLGIAAAPRPLAAQVLVAPSRPDTSRAAVFRRAQRLVTDGNGAEGRALVDSLLNLTEPRSAGEAEVLFWRATLAESWDAAQRDYLRVMLEHERSPYAASAMLRLAQGELMRGDREGALRYVDRLLAESAADAPERAEAQALRGRLVPASTTAASAAGGATGGATAGAAGGGVGPGAGTPVTPSTPGPPGGAMAWTVQVAAFPTADEAATFAALVRERGYDTRVDGTTAPFRVRFGYFATRAAAAAAMDAYKTRERADAFLTQVPRP